MYNNVLVLFALAFASAIGERMVPGVPPKNYQQPPPPQYQQQQYQQQPQQHLPPDVNHQYQQMQYQQPPVQQGPVHPQVPVQQVPQSHHAPHDHHSPQRVLNTNIQHEREHIQEHMQVPSIDTSKMNEAELQFHYFKMHDSDNNNKLDGCELIKSLIHWHAGEETKEKNKETKGNNGNTYNDESLAEAVDYVLDNMDLNKDGYVDYAEYRKSEEKTSQGNQPVN